VNYRAIIVCAVIGVLTACHSRPVAEQRLQTRPEPQTPVEAPPPNPPLEEQTPETTPVPNADVANTIPPCLPEAPKPKVVKRRPRPAPENDKPAPAEPQPVRVATAPEVKPIEASVASILGKKVQGADGDDLGRVVDVQADANGRVRLVILEFGGFLGVGNRRAAVDWGLLRFHPDDPDRPISLTVDAKVVQGTPEYRQASHPQALMAPVPISAPTPAATPTPPPTTTPAPAAAPPPAATPAPAPQAPPQQNPPPANTAPPQNK
jgi:PRC-barrel domain